MEQPTYYAVIPANVRYDKRLNANEKLLYGEITTLTMKTGECWASNNYFAELYGCTPQAISKWIRNIEKCGYIKTELSRKKDSKEIDKRTIRLVPTGAEEVSTDVSEVSTCVDRGINCRLGGYQQTIKGNNTSINNTSINNIYSVYEENEQCDCITKSTNKRCERRATYSIDGKNYCNQHSREIFGNIFKKERKKFVKPTLEEVQNYIQEKNLNVSAENFINYFEATDWVDSKGNKVRSWKGKLLTWSSYKKQPVAPPPIEVREEDKWEAVRKKLESEGTLDDV